MSPPLLHHVLGLDSVDPPSTREARDGVRRAPARCGNGDDARAVVALSRRHSEAVRVGEITLPPRTPRSPSCPAFARGAGAQNHARGHRTPDAGGLFELTADATTKLPRWLEEDRASETQSARAARRHYHKLCALQRLAQLDRDGVEQAHEQIGVEDRFHRLAHTEARGTVPGIPQHRKGTLDILCVPTCCWGSIPAASGPALANALLIIVTPKSVLE